MLFGVADLIAFISGTITLDRETSRAPGRPWARP